MLLKVQLSTIRFLATVFGTEVLLLNINHMAVVAASGGEEEAFAGLQPSTCALNGNSDHALQISSILYQDKKPWGRVNMPESENYVRDETAQDRLEHSDDCIITVRLDPDTERGNSETLCQTVAVYSREAVPQLSWTADRAWYVVGLPLVL